MRGTVLTLLRDEGPMPRVEIAKRLALSATTITRVVNSLVTDGILAEGNSVSPMRLGRPATEVAIRDNTVFVFGIQISIGSISVGIGDPLGRLHGSVQFAYEPDTDIEAVLDRMAMEALLLASQSGIDKNRFIGVGLAVPGPVDEDGRLLVHPVNLAWRNVAIADLLERRLGLPVHVEHNVRSMALAEARFGGGKGLTSVGYVYLNAGLGAGLVVEGQPFSGGVNGAIEIGHLQVYTDGRICRCGGKGCVETVVSNEALSETARTLGLPRSAHPLTTILDAGATMPDAAIAAERITDALSMAISVMANVLNPQKILLGGTLAQVDEGFFSGLVSQTRKRMFPMIQQSIQMQKSVLGPNPGVYGGITVALDRFFYA